MSDQTGNLGVSAGGTTPEPKKVAGAAKKAPAAEAGMVSLSTTVEAELAERIVTRAAHEERTQAVLIRRALRAYMKDWTPGADD